MNMGQQHQVNGGRIDPRSAQILRQMPARIAHQRSGTCIDQNQLLTGVDDKGVDGGFGLHCHIGLRHLRL